MSARKFDLSKSKSFGNVKVIRDSRSVKVKLHQTIVVHFDCLTGSIILSSGGWKTPTTKTAINTALKQLDPSMSVYQKKGAWYLYSSESGSVEFSDGMEVTHNSERVAA